MKLDRNTNESGDGKYALVRKRRLREVLDGPRAIARRVQYAMKLLADSGVLDDSAVGDEGEFFVIRLKDEYARDALMAYADAAEGDDEEYAEEVRELASRSSDRSPWCKRPD